MARSEHDKDKPLVLVIDDEPNILTALSLLLEDEGYQVITARHGLEGLERLRTARPDLIITDYMMPHMTGVELIEEVRAGPEWSHIPILLMSAALPRDIKPAEVADAFLPKALNSTNPKRNATPH